MKDFLFNYGLLIVLALCVVLAVLRIRRHLR